MRIRSPLLFSFPKSACFTAAETCRISVQIGLMLFPYLVSCHRWIPRPDWRHNAGDSHRSPRNAQRRGRPSSRLLRRVVVLNRSSLASEWDEGQLPHPSPRHSPDRTRLAIPCDSRLGPARSAAATRDSNVLNRPNVGSAVRSVSGRNGSRLRAL